MVAQSHAYALSHGVVIEKFLLSVVNAVPNASTANAETMLEVDANQLLKQDVNRRHPDLFKGLQLGPGRLENCAIYDHSDDFHFATEVFTQPPGLASAYL